MVQTLFFLAADRPFFWWRGVGFAELLELGGK